MVWQKLRNLDARVFQILFLSSFLIAGLSLLSFDVTPLQCLLCITACLAAQWAGLHYFNVPTKAYASACITGLSLCLLLRANALWVHPLAGFLAIGSKFLLRSKQKHIFNPANFGIVLALLLTPSWISTGQWGHALLQAGWLIALGFVVTHRAQTRWISLKFLCLFMLLVGLRNAWLGFEFALTVHAFQNGALLLFAFFMVSDPKTNPDTSLAQWGHLTLLVLLFALLKFEAQRPAALFYALFIACIAGWLVSLLANLGHRLEALTNKKIFASSKIQ
jgi:Na+-transporting NADH:ubiquinone oxidoreductase subunit NqrB